VGSIVRYLFCVFAITWACWFTAAGYLDPYLPLTFDRSSKAVLIAIGVFTPGIVALVTMVIAGGWTGVGALLLRLVRWRVGWRWYAFAVLFMPVIKLAAAGVYRLEFDRWPAFGHENPILMLAATFASVLLIGQAGEELGWRGFALPRLSLGMGLAPASVVLGVVWAAWHLPLFFIFPQADTYGQSFPLYLAQVTALSVAISWLWWRTNGSLLLTMLFHAAVNNLKDIVPSASPRAGDVFSLSGSAVGWITVALLWAAAFGFLIHMAWKAGRFTSGSIPKTAGPSEAAA
jgi:membrane protease YdiL (CAAX protease family)